MDGSSSRPWGLVWSVGIAVALLATTLLGGSSATVPTAKAEGTGTVALSILSIMDESGATLSQLPGSMQLSAFANQLAPNPNPGNTGNGSFTTGGAASVTGTNPSGGTFGWAADVKTSITSQLVATATPAGSYGGADDALASIGIVNRDEVPYTLVLAVDFEYALSATRDDPATQSASTEVQIFANPTLAPTLVDCPSGQVSVANSIELAGVTIDTTAGNASATQASTRCTFSITVPPNPIDTVVVHTVGTSALVLGDATSGRTTLEIEKMVAGGAGGEQFSFTYECDGQSGEAVAPLGNGGVASFEVTGRTSCTVTETGVVGGSLDDWITTTNPIGGVANGFPSVSLELRPGEANRVTFTNTRAAGLALEVSKEVVGGSGAEVFEFTYECVAPGRTGNPIPFALGPANSYTQRFDVVAFAGGECTVIETGVQGGSLSDWETLPASGRIVVQIPQRGATDQTVEAAFVNSRKASRVLLEVTNSVIGGTGTESFTFAVSCVPPQGAATDVATFDLGDGGSNVTDVSAFAGGSCTVTETEVTPGVLAEWEVQPANPQTVSLPNGTTFAAPVVGTAGGGRLSAAGPLRFSLVRLQQPPVTVTVGFLNCRIGPYTGGCPPVN